MFSEYQRELLMAARQRIEDRTSRFICNALSDVCQVNSELPYDMRWSAARQIKEEIELGIDDYSCFELWIFSEVGVYPEDVHQEARDVWDKFAFNGWNTCLSREDFKELCRHCRLAWIDRALERGTLV
jgi:hypothetical protein